MKLSEIFLMISNKIFEDTRSINNRCDMFKKDFVINSKEPLNITGELSILENEVSSFDDIDIDLKGGSFYIYDETGHNGSWSIVECKSIADAEKYILSSGVYTNMFCTYCIVFNKYGIVEFDVYYIDDNGARQYIDIGFDFELDKLNINWKIKG